MEKSNITLVYFSATYTTKKVVKSIAEVFNHKMTEYDITQEIPDGDVIVDNNNILIVGVPVYAGRVPANAIEGLNRFKGNGNPAVIVCVYGNRDYDDALLELKNVIQGNGFKVVSAGVFIGQHSIFHTVGKNRPDKEDITATKEFAEKTVELFTSISDTGFLEDIIVKGNMPYKIPGNIPIKPKGNKKCNKCGICVKLCPVTAIPSDLPRKTNKEKCISCGRCIVVCPQNARHFDGILYKMANKKFIKAFSGRKEPEMIFVKY